MNDTMRIVYRELTAAEQARVIEIKNAAANLRGIALSAYGASPRVESPENTPKAQCLYRALERLEESVMWAVKGITG